MAKRELPQQFRDLEPYLDWSLPTERERCTKRQASSFEQLSAFYDALFPRMEAILPFLAGFGLDNSDPEVECLLHLTFSLAEVATAVENFKQPSAVDGYDVARFVAMHE